MSSSSSSNNRAVLSLVLLLLFIYFKNTFLLSSAVLVSFNSNWTLVLWVISLQWWTASLYSSHAIWPCFQWPCAFFFCLSSRRWSLFSQDSLFFNCGQLMHVSQGWQSFISSVDLLWLPDAPQPVHLIPKLWPQAEQFFYLGTTPTGILISAIRHRNKTQGHSAAWDMDGCVFLFLLTHKASHFITKGNQVDQVLFTFH